MRHDQVLELDPANYKATIRHIKSLVGLGDGAQACSLIVAAKKVETQWGAHRGPALT